jgi:GNAT superfamily N-acetyltransferase
LYQLGQKAKNFAFFRPAVHLLFRENDLAVADDVELRLLALDRRGVDPCRLQLGRETRGPCVIPVSDGAVEDLDHEASLYSREMAAAGGSSPMLTIADADPDEARALFLEYAQALGVDLSYQDFDRELAELPGDYARPAGRLLAARLGDETVGCVALRPAGGEACEMKRLFVRPGHRGSGAGRALAEAVIAAARESGYTSMRLDTLPQMQTAQAMYETLGFRETEPYYPSPVPGTRFLELDLSGVGVDHM